MGVEFDFFCLALTRSLLNDRFALRTMRGFSGNKLYSNGSFSTSSQISLRVCLTSGMCPLYVRDKKEVLGSGFICSFFFLYIILCLSLKCIFLISGLIIFRCILSPGAPVQVSWSVH